MNLPLGAIPTNNVGAFGVRVKYDNFDLEGGYAYDLYPGPISVEYQVM